MTTHTILEQPRTTGNDPKRHKKGDFVAELLSEYKDYSDEEFRSILREKMVERDNHLSKDVYRRANAREEDYENGRIVRSIQYQQLQRFEVLDSVFRDFLATNMNRKKRYSLKEIINWEFGANNRFGGSVYENFFSFEHLSIPYLATIVLFSDQHDTWINIKLINNGFIYRFKNGNFVTRHPSKGVISKDWIELESGWSGFVSVKKELQQLGYSEEDDVTVWYNFELQRVDVKIIPKNESLPPLMITFEPGVPDMESTRSHNRYKW